MLAMGIPDVPVGQYTAKILSCFELKENQLAAGTVTYGSNVKEVTTQGSEATVDCSIIYQTDAFSADLTIVDASTAEMCGQGHLSRRCPERIQERCGLSGISGLLDR